MFYTFSTGSAPATPDPGLPFPYISFIGSCDWITVASSDQYDFESIAVYSLRVTSSGYLSNFIASITTTEDGDLPAGSTIQAVIWTSDPGSTIFTRSIFSASVAIGQTNPAAGTVYNIVGGPVALPVSAGSAIAVSIGISSPTTPTTVPGLSVTGGYRVTSEQVYDFVSTSQQYNLTSPNQGALIASTFSSNTVGTINTDSSGRLYIDENQVLNSGTLPIGMTYKLARGGTVSDIRCRGVISGDQLPLIIRLFVARQNQSIYTDTGVSATLFNPTASIVAGREFIPNGTAGLVLPGSRILVVVSLANSTNTGSVSLDATGSFTLT